MPLVKLGVRNVSPLDETHFTFSCAPRGLLDSTGQQC